MKETAKVVLCVYQYDLEPKVEILLEDTIEKCQLYILRRAEQVLNEKNLYKGELSVNNCGLLRFDWNGENDEQMVLEMIEPWM